MTTHVAPSHFRPARAPIRSTELDALSALVPVGRVLLSAIFIISAPGHFTAKSIGYAASQGVPMPNVLVPLAGVLALAGGLSLALGYRARIGALLLAAFLLPVTFMMHAFWSIGDPMMAEMQRIMFMKNVAMLGGVLLVLYFGAGPFSLDARRLR